MAIISGIDEAGRGPVIGPLVIAGVSIDEKDLNKLKEFGVRDSKLLSPKQREDLFDKITHTAREYKIIIISPKEIDSALKSKNLNLNWLEAIKSAEIIDSLKPEKAIIDCPSNNVTNYKNFLKKHLKDKKTELIVEHKADFKYVVVSAASIVAKVTRDREIKKIQKRIKEPIGSGYPSDPVTINFLEKNYSNYSEIFRKEWASWKKLNKKKKQKSLKDFQ
jgi:ribonuclease HII